jgi:hypothetical protein
MRLGTARRCQQPLDFGQHGAGLLGNGCAFLALAGQIDRVAVDHGLAHALAGFDAGDGHGKVLQ